MKHFIAAGSALGRDHALLERPNQDAFSVQQGEWGAAAVVCDGCGSEPHSGVGARLGAVLTARLAAAQAAQGGPLDLERLRADILARLSLVALETGISPREHLLFTIVGAVSTEAGAELFACGDGVVAVDGAVRRLGPFPGNQPPYLAYALEGAAVGFASLYRGRAARLLVGTDGAAEADLAPFWSDERVWRNPDMVRRLLRRQSLADDASVAVVLRRGP
ncbi:MAG: protein phosphatase 2C domain-containing protein [Elusimicrobia bacterium]|nr:protein phosphatase 2C domain-containing protein [Elusimicrobiota bacterium]